MKRFYVHIVRKISLDHVPFLIETLEQSWSDCPMGYCPGYPVDFTSLELPESVDELGQEGAELTWEHSHR